MVVQGKPTKVHVHGGLFKSCYPYTYKGTWKYFFVFMMSQFYEEFLFSSLKDDDGNLQMVDGVEECSSIEELAGTPVGRSMGIGKVSFLNQAHHRQVLM